MPLTPSGDLCRNLAGKRIVQGRPTSVRAAGVRFIDGDALGIHPEVANFFNEMRDGRYVVADRNAH